MIFKSFEINKINKKIYQLILFYGKNEGLKNEALSILIKDKNNVQNYEEKIDSINNAISTSYTRDHGFWTKGDIKKIYNIIEYFFDD